MTTPQNATPELPLFYQIMMSEIIGQRNKAMDDLSAARAALLVTEKELNDLRAMVAAQNEAKKQVGEGDTSA